LEFDEDMTLDLIN